jgi:hypothetical protein
MRRSRPERVRHTPEELVEYLWRNRIFVEGCLEEVEARMLAADPDRRRRVIDEWEKERTQRATP